MLDLGMAVVTFRARCGFGGGLTVVLFRDGAIGVLGRYGRCRQIAPALSDNSDWLKWLGVGVSS
jgi:hypothetical protein